MGTSWVFGIDGGGTSSRLRAESLSGERLYAGSGGGTNLNAADAATVTGTLRDLVAGALASGLAPDDCRAGFIGSAGVDLPEDRITMASALSAAFGAARAIARSSSDGRGSGHGRDAGEASAGARPAFGAGNDAEPALVGALADTEGFLLIAGTGSIALGMTHGGRHERAGGWGHFLGDEGSAFWIAFEAIKRGIRAGEDRDAKTGLLAEAVSFFGLPDERAFIPLTYWNFDKARIASFAPRVAALAGKGDALASAILDEAADELCSLVASVYGRLGDEVGRKRVALYGGLIEPGRFLREPVKRRLASRLPELAVAEPAGDAPTGACRLARGLVGL